MNTKQFMSNYLSGKYYLPGYLTPATQKSLLKKLFAGCKNQIKLLERSEK